MKCRAAPSLICVCFILLTVTGCISRIYDGPSRPKDQVALIKGTGGIPAALSPYMIDNHQGLAGKYTPWWEVLPGEHTVRWRYQENQIIFGRYPSIQNIYSSVGTCKFEAQAGHVYALWHNTQNVGSGPYCRSIEVWIEDLTDEYHRE